MTAIPGTATPKSASVLPPSPVLKTKMPLAQLPIHEEPVQTSYVPDPTGKKTDDTLPWHQTLLSWMSFGTILGVLASLVGFKVKNLLVLAPLGPTVGAIAWFVRRFANKNLKKFDGLQ